MKAAGLALLMALTVALAGPAAAKQSAVVSTETASLVVVVLDHRSGEPLPFASVSVTPAEIDAESDAAGRVEVAELPAGLVDVVVAMEGYRRTTLSLELRPGVRVEVEVRMRKGKRPRNETVVASAPPWRIVDRTPLPAGGAPSTHSLSRRDLELAPGGFGDPLRAVQKLPGVSGDEGSRAWLRVRGGLEGELRVEIDGIEVRHLTHADGIVSLFHRDLVRGLTVHTSGSPVDRPSGMAGGLYLEYLDGPTDRQDAAIDLSLLAGSAMVATQGPEERSRLVLGARVSFLSAYLAIAKAAGAFEGSVPKANYSEAFFRFSQQVGDDHRLRLTVLSTTDRLLFDDVNQRFQTLGGAFDWRWDYHPGCHLDLQIAHASNFADEPDAGEFGLPVPRTWRDDHHRTHLRIGNHHVFGGRTLSYGGEAAVRSRTVRGEFEDRRGVPAWAWLPLADLATDRLQLDTTSSWPEVALWGRAAFPGVVGPLELHVAVRLELLNRAKRPAFGPRFSLVLPLKTGTTVSGTFALVHAERIDALVVDKDVGERSLKPERAAWFEVAVEQELFDALLIGVAGWHRQHDNLVVFGPSGWTNAGVGRGTGLEVRASLRVGRVAADVSYAVGISARNDPYRAGWSAAGGDQRHEVQASADVALGARRRSHLSADVGWRSGWAIASLSPVDAGDGTFRWTLDGLDDRRTDGQLRVAARFEHSHEGRRARLVGSAEVAATPLGAGVVEDCPPLPDEDGSDPACRTLDFLPVVMPWVGLRLEW